MTTNAAEAWLIREELETRALARLELLRREAANDVEAAVEYAGLMSPGSRTRWERPRHLRQFTKMLNRTLAGESVFGLVSVPPRHGKTETVLHFLVALLKRQPRMRVLFTAYSSEQARRKSLRALQIAAALGLKLGKQNLANDPTQRTSQTVSYWQTAEGGTFAAVGRNGAITGEGFDVIVIDDPYKGREEAESPVLRQKVWEFFTDVAYTRLEPGGSLFIIHTRWHEDDLIGRLGAQVRRTQQAKAEGRDTDADEDGLFTGEPWEVCNLRALTPQLASNDNGEIDHVEELALWEKRYSAERLGIIRSTVGPYTWASLYQGEPRARGSRLFIEPQRFHTAEPVPIPRNATVLISADAAGTEKESADYNALVVAAYWRELVVVDEQKVELLHGRMLYAWKRQCSIPDFVDVLFEVQQRFDCPVLVEQQGGEGRSTVQMLRRVAKEKARPIRVIGTPVKGDKYTRSQVPAAAWNAGRYQVPYTPWAADVLEVTSVFTGVADAEDDIVDAITLGWNWVLRRMSAGKSRSGRKSRSIAESLPKTLQPREPEQRKPRSRARRSRQPRGQSSIRRQV